MPIDDFNRRTILAAGLGAIAAGAAAAPLDLTARQDLGPFYPVMRPLDQDADLTRVSGRRGVASGQRIIISGRVLDHAGRAVPHAALDIWQANSHGRYAHPGDTHDAPLDPNFQGSAKIVADAAGRYRFVTIKPGAYPIGGGLQRTPHIHVDVMGRSQRLTTQIYFPGEPLNATDILFPHASPQASVIARALGAVPGAAETLAFGWDVVLMTG